MTSSPPTPPRVLAGARAALRELFSLKGDSADDAEIDERLRAGVSMQGTNLWVLMARTSPSIWDVLIALFGGLLESLA